MVIAWLDRILLSFPRESVDRVAMGLAAVAVLFVAALLVTVALAGGRAPAEGEG